jgi:hypothetical protein
MEEDIFKKNKLGKISKTLKKIEKKMEDKSPHFGTNWSNFFDYEKIQEGERKKREEKRNEEILNLQRAQSDSIKNQENFNKIIAFTGGIIALTTIYAFIVQSINLKCYPIYYWIITIIFLLFAIFCIVPLIGFIIPIFWSIFTQNSQKISNENLDKKT